MSTCMCACVFVLFVFNIDVELASLQSRRDSGHMSGSVPAVCRTTDSVIKKDVVMHHSSDMVMHHSSEVWIDAHAN